MNCENCVLNFTSRVFNKINNFSNCHTLTNLVCLDFLFASIINNLLTFIVVVINTEYL